MLIKCEIYTHKNKLEKCTLISHFALLLDPTGGFPSPRLPGSAPFEKYWAPPL